MALSTATYDLNRQKQNLDIVLNDVTTSVYPLNNRLTDWESVIENRENQRRLLLGPQSRSFMVERRSEFTPSIQVVSSIAADEVEHTPIDPILVLPEGGVVNDEIHPLDEAVTSNESVG